MANIQGTNGNDILNGGDDSDTLKGLAGNDTLNGGRGDDTLDGGTGSDLLQGGYENDTYIIDNLGDRIVEVQDSSEGGEDSVYSSVTLTLGNYLENLFLTGTDAINGTGNALSNILSGNQANNVLSAGDGNDYIWGGFGGKDTLIGGAGNDDYTVDADDIIIENPNAGIDTVNSAASYALGANLENLTLDGYAAINGRGNELNNNIRGNFGTNVLVGGGGNDRISGLDGNDVLCGGTGTDSLIGGSGKNRLIGGLGNDVLTGGAGADLFIRKYSTTGIDTITDFQVGQDKLCFSAKGFGGGLVRGVLAQAQFTLGTAATDSSDRFIYNQATGALFFDADGTGANQQVQIATLSTGLALTHADISILI